MRAASGPSSGMQRLMVGALAAAAACQMPPAASDAAPAPHDDGGPITTDAAPPDTGDDGGPRPPPNVLILLTDDQRHDTVHALGNQMIQTPNMDRLARAGTSFTQASIQGGIGGAVCITSRAALMTGRTINHLDGADTIPASHQTLPELLRQAGYVTFATGKWHNDIPSHVRSFDTGDNIFFGGMHFPEDGGHEHPLLYHFDPTGTYPLESRFVGDRFSSVMYADAAVAFLETAPQLGRPFFAYVAFTAPHDPRTPPAPFDAMYDPAQTPLWENFMPQHPFDNGELHNRDEDLLGFPRDPALVRKEIAAYYGMISEVDSQIGRILDALEQQGLRDNTIIVFAGDNGLALGAHGLLGKQNLYEESARIPMIVAGPGIAANATDERFVQLHDVMSTLADLLGIDPPATSEGIAFLGPHAAAFSRPTSYHQYYEIHRGIRTTDQWKMIGYRAADGDPGAPFYRVQLFDLAADPYELNDLSAMSAYQSKLTALQSLLAGERGHYADPLR